MTDLLMTEAAQEAGNYLAASGYGLMQVGNDQIELTDGVCCVTLTATKFLGMLQAKERVARIQRGAKANPADQTLRRWARDFGISTSRNRRKRPYREVQQDVLLAAEIAITITV